MPHDTLSAKTSRMIFDLIGNFPTKKRWDQSNFGYLLTEHGAVPAPDFGETLRIIVKIGEKKGFTPLNTRRSLDRIAEEYIDAPTPTLGMEAVDKMVAGLISK